MPAAHEELEGRLRVQAKGCIVLGSRFVHFFDVPPPLDRGAEVTSMAHGTDVRWLAS